MAIDPAALSPFEPGTFAGLPRLASGDAPAAAILGVPFDLGRNGYRIGSRQGPDAIRRTAQPDRRFLFHSDRDFLAELGVVDCGNVGLVPSETEEAYEAIEAAATAIHAAGTLPVSMGGDGAVTLPQLRAAYRKYGELAVVHCDAHTDAWDVPGTGRYTTTNTFLRAHEEGLADPTATFHIGPRGMLSSMGGTLSNVSKLGQQIIPMDEFADQGPAAVAAHVKSVLGDRPVYICWDMDFFDPSAAPGVAVPEWGGATPREGLSLLRDFGALNAIAFDINTVSPPHDVQNMTAHLAGRVIMEFLELTAARRATTVA